MATNETRVLGLIQVEDQLAQANCPRRGQTGLVQDLLTILLGLPAEVQTSDSPNSRVSPRGPATTIRADLEQLRAELKLETAAVLQ
jgi:hypothetical protein